MNLRLFYTLLLITTFCSAQQVTIYCIGDSTMADKQNAENNPEHGWAQVLPYFFDETIKIDNRAVNGRSSKSFITEGRWDSVLKTLSPDDYVFIQFGHNDQKIKDSSRYTNPHTTYRENLKRFVQDVIKRDAYPVLFSSIVRRNFNEYGTFVDTHGAYPLETRLVAQELKIPFIDLQYLTEIMETSYGVEDSKALHLHFKPGEHSYYADGIEDNTHLSRKGAFEVSKLVIEQIKLLKLSLKDHIK